MEINSGKRMAVFFMAAVMLAFAYPRLCAGALPVNAGASPKKYVALTFDDGPKAGTTDILLEGLRERGVLATFFLIGRQIEGNAALVRQMAKDGHLIGNHTYNHVNLADLSQRDAAHELNECFGEIYAVTGQQRCVLRPPFGEVGVALKTKADAPIILWSVDTRDWTGKSGADIADYIVDTARDGDIILLHDIFEDSVEGALMAIDSMLENGYTFVTVDELFKRKGIPLEEGKIYRKTYD